MSLAISLRSPLESLEYQAGEGRVEEHVPVKQTWVRNMAAVSLTLSTDASRDYLGKTTLFRGGHAFGTALFALEGGI